MSLTPGLLTGEAKRTKGSLLALAHSAAILDLFVIVAEHVQHAVHNEVAKLAIQRVAEVACLSRRC